MQYDLDTSIIEGFNMQWSLFALDFFQKKKLFALEQRLFPNKTRYTHVFSLYSYNLQFYTPKYWEL